MDKSLFLIALAAFGGGILSAFAGWLDSGELFTPRKFGKSLIFALISGIGFAVGYSLTGPIAIRDLFLAVLSGAGVDAISNRVIGAITPKP